jgi:hypothetical protein
MQTIGVRVRVTLWRTVYRKSFRLCTKSLETHDQYFFSTEHLLLKSLRNICSDERMSLSFTIAAGPRHGSHSRVWVPRDSWPYYTLSDSRFPQTGWPGPLIYISREQICLVISPGIGLNFVDSYDLQGHDGGIRTRLHTRGCKVKKTEHTKICCSYIRAIPVWVCIHYGGRTVRVLCGNKLY